MTPELVAFEIINIFLLLITAVTAIAVIEVRSLFAATVLSGFYSLIMALIYQNMDAMDVSFTEAAVGAGISTILLLGALVYVGRDSKPSRLKINGPALLVVLVTGGALVYGTLDMPRYGDPEANIHTLRTHNFVTQRVGKTHDLEGRKLVDSYHMTADGWRSPDAAKYGRSDAASDVGTDDYKPVGIEALQRQAEQERVEAHAAHAHTEKHGQAGDAQAHGDDHHKHYPEDDWDGHVPNTVTSLLAGYRGFDTMLETAVIFIAGMALVLLLRRRTPVAVARGGDRHVSSVAPAVSPKTPFEQFQSKMSDQVVLRVVARLDIAFIVLFGLYVITHGEIGPGGGFQGGVIIAAGFILYGLIFGRDELERILPHRFCDLLAAGGVLIYAGIGFACFFAGGHFLDYRALFPTWPALGLSLVEYGVGLTVATVMITIFNKITEPDKPIAAGAGQGEGAAS